jgi:hypothetical protein
MHSVFVAGSRALSKLSAQVKERLDNVIKRQLTVLVGDANGVDKAVQRYLAESTYHHVIVYCMEVCRNNLGHWPTREHRINSLRHDRNYYGVKDFSMARDADYGLMIWDGSSKGTLTNVLNLLGLDKKVVLFSARKARFFTLRSLDDLHRTLHENGISDVEALIDSLEPKSQEQLRLSALHS